MEHVVFRDLELLARKDRSERIKSVRQVGQRLSLTRGVKRRWTFHQPQIDDVIWWVVKEIGAFAKVKVLEKPQSRLVKTIGDLEEIRNDRSLIDEALSDDNAYWRMEEEKLRETGILSLQIIKVETIEALTKPFAVPNAPRQSLVSLETQEDRERYLSLVDRPVVQTFFQDDDTYTDIDDATRFRLDLVYGPNMSVYGKSPHNIDIDHFVPLRIGGPGKIVQNLVPLSYADNRSKGGKIPFALVKVASKYMDFPQCARDGSEWQLLGQTWKEAIDRWPRQRRGIKPLLLLESDYLGVQITDYIRLQPVEVQRRFYFEVMKEGCLNPPWRGTAAHIETKYREAHVKEPVYYDDVFGMLNGKITRTSDGSLEFKRD